jgi:RNA polymerase sigma-70 factor (ECF subfamily)
VDDNREYIDLVRRAQLGDRDSLDKLTGLVRARLRVYVYRILLHDDVTEDIVQESLLEMVKVLGKLKRADRFWPWLRSIAFNRIRNYYKVKKRQKTIPMPSGDRDSPEDRSAQETSGLNQLLGEELKETVFSAMRRLKPRYRTVLTMRCYEEMEYSAIAELLQCSELNARVTFHRAKASLLKHLSKSGLRKEFLLSALILFGQMTAPSEAAAVSISITAATLRTGMAAGLIAFAGNKSAIIAMKVAAVTLTTGGLFVAGNMLPTRWVDKTMFWSDKKIATIQEKITRALPPRSRDHGDECWYYYPLDSQGPVMIRMVEQNLQTGGSYCKHLQDDQGNYRFDKESNTIYIENYRLWSSDLKVRRLPTDKSRLQNFLSLLDDSDVPMEYVSSEQNGLLVVAKHEPQGSYSQVTHRHNLSDEEYFRYDWPGWAQVVDNRDEMHKRGWTYFKITGMINNEEVSGFGRIPFVYAAAKSYRPWLRLKTGGGLVLLDTGEQACVSRASGEPFAKYRGNSFFKGLSRPWMGLHTIDTIRRDAAEEQIHFDTEYSAETNKAKIVLTSEENQIVYTIDMEKDVIERIDFSVSESMGRDAKGQFIFTYLEDVDDAGEEFAEPRTKTAKSSQQNGPGIMWLIKLAAGTLGK